MTPIDSAMGRAIRLGRGTPDTYPQTVSLLKQLIASRMTTSTVGPKSVAPAAPAGPTTQDRAP
jgi:hypothetical protein